MRGEVRDAFLGDLRQRWPVAMLFGIGVDSIPLEALTDELLKYLETADAPVHIVTLNPEILEHALADSSLMEAIRSADLIVPDGIGIRLAAKKLAHRELPKVPGVDLAHRLLEKSAARGWEIYLLGGAPSVATDAEGNLKVAIPSLNIIGTEHGYHRDTPEHPKDETRVLNTIIALQPDILLVGMGSPRQEEVIAKLKPRLNRAILIGVGGSLDVYAGSVKRAPAFFATVHLEWLWRMLSQPQRLKRLPVLLRFAWRVIRS